MRAKTPRRGFDLSQADTDTKLVIQSVLPVFTNHEDRPDHYGTCILVRIDGYPFMVTAAHVVVETLRVARRFTVGLGGKLLTPFRRDRFVTLPDDPIDLALIPLSAQQHEHFVAQGAVFLGPDRIDEQEKGDGADFLNMLANVYLAIGFPVTRSRIQHGQRKIGLKIFSVKLTLAESLPRNIRADQQLVLDYADLRLDGRDVHPPKLQGMSGGGVFRYTRRAPETIKLVGILTEHDKRSRIMIGTRIREATAIARQIISRYPEALR